MRLKVFGPNGIKEYDAYLDTGATKTLIPESDAKQLGLKYSGDIMIITASGEDVFHLYEAEVEFLGKKFSILVLGKDLPKTTAIRSIIGRDILDNFKVCFNGKSKSIEIFDT